MATRYDVTIAKPFRRADIAEQAVASTGVIAELIVDYDALAAVEMPKWIVQSTQYERGPDFLTWHLRRWVLEQLNQRAVGHPWLPGA